MHNLCMNYVRYRKVIARSCNLMLSGNDIELNNLYSYKFCCHIYSIIV